MQRNFQAIRIVNTLLVLLSIAMLIIFFCQNNENEYRLFEDSPEISNEDYFYKDSN